MTTKIEVKETLSNEAKQAIHGLMDDVCIKVEPNGSPDFRYILENSAHVLSVEEE